MDARNTFEVVRGVLLVPSWSFADMPKQEIKPGMIELMKPKLTFAQSEIQDGDVICFQVDLPDKE